ncbi:hypothetical protein Pcinc_038325 [Petrolisthes cinctipes]|uniref:Uncharacterized protein n=1 Tax=Petrolisthes cinctipes TaxID=88211 RepID=A0AAE1BQW3_PETCI|nr:hypothetical protein Pcinc_038325 [Petrolisthes cinctipes]
MSGGGGFAGSHGPTRTCCTGVSFYGGDGEDDGDWLPLTLPPDEAGWGEKRRERGSRQEDSNNSNQEETETTTRAPTPAPADTTTQAPAVPATLPTHRTSCNFHLVSSSQATHLPTNQPTTISCRYIPFLPACLSTSSQPDHSQPLTGGCGEGQTGPSASHVPDSGAPLAVAILSLY